MTTEHSRQPYRPASQISTGGVADCPYRGVGVRRFAMPGPWCSWTTGSTDPARGRVVLRSAIPMCSRRKQAFDILGSPLPAGSHFVSTP